MSAETRPRPDLRPGVLASVMHEIAGRLAALAEAGEVSVIDLRSLPITEAERDALRARLGRGDTEALLNVAGASELWETRYAGVWWIRHFGAGDKIAAELIEITAIPEILVTDADDIAEAARCLATDLVKSDAPGTPETPNA
jgi:HupH hydrogenase expression protein, C-terminal conserved region